MSDKSTKDVKVTFRITSEMMEQVQQVMETDNHRNLSEFITHCVRTYLDETGQAVGSRGYASKRINERLDALESLIWWHSLQNQMVTSRGLFTVLDELAPEDAEKDPPTPDIQIRMASDHGRQFLTRFLHEQTPIVNDITEYRRKLAKKHNE